MSTHFETISLSAHDDGQVTIELYQQIQARSIGNSSRDDEDDIPSEESVGIMNSLKKILCSCNCWDGRHKSFEKLQMNESTKLARNHNT